MTEYTPDNWVILRMTYQDQIIYKLLGGWGGSYINGSSWRLNGGIEKCEYDITNDKWRFYGSSGSVYVVNPDSYGLRMATVDAYTKMKKSYPNQVEMLEDCDWSQKDWTK